MSAKGFWMHGIGIYLSTWKFVRNFTTPMMVWVDFKPTCRFFFLHSKYRLQLTSMGFYGALCWLPWVSISNKQIRARKTETKKPLRTSFQLIFLGEIHGLHFPIRKLCQVGTKLLPVIVQRWHGCFFIWLPGKRITFKFRQLDFDFRDFRWF